MKRLAMVLLFFTLPLSAADTSWKIRGLASDSLSSKDLMGKPIVLQFWGSWCRSCSEVFYDMEKTLGSDNKISYYSVSVDETKQQVRDYLKDHPLKSFLSSRTYHDQENKLSKIMKVETVPTIIVLNKKGESVYRMKGHYSTAQFQKFTTILNSMRKTL